jgi:hypothetical protein
MSEHGEVVSRLDAVKQQEKVCEDWRGYVSTWTWIYYALNIVIVGLSTANAAKPFGLDVHTGLWSGLAWFLAFATAANALLRPSERFDRYRRAWSLLTVTLTRYHADKTYILNDVLDAYERGEAIIHESPATWRPRSS